MSKPLWPPLPTPAACLTWNISFRFSVDRPLLIALRDYHAARSNPAPGAAQRLLDSARRNALEAERLALQLFPNPVDAAATEVRALRLYPRKLMQAMDTQR